MTHLELALELRHGLKRDANHDEDGRSAEGLEERGRRRLEREQNLRKHRDRGQEERARKGDPVEDVLDVGLGLLTRAHARNKTTVLAEVVSEVDRIEDEGCIEVREEDDEERIQEDVQPPV